MNFAALALVMTAGLVGPLLASAHRFAPPVIVGEIAAGVIIGTSGLGWVDPADPLLNGLANIG
ncbi:MAG: cation:proton antiporter, partial [Ilumatobacteraceae bacterium]